MKISHRQLRLILRICFCLGAFFGLFVFIYELAINRSIPFIICYICYLIVTGAILYLLFARKRPGSRFAYGTFYSLCFVTVLFFLGYIYESVTLVPRMTNDLINHIEENGNINAPGSVLIRLSKCCSIDDERHTTENFEIFQEKYPNTCGTIEFDDAQPCLPFIRSQRNLTMFLSCFIMIFRLLILFFLWRYIKDEYKIENDERIDFLSNDSERSTTTTLA